VQQALGVIPQGPDSTVELGLSDDVSPGVIRTESDQQYTYVVMPMRL